VVVPKKVPVVERFAIAGAPAEARGQMERLVSTGLVDETAIIPHTQEPVERERILRLVGEMIPDLSQGVGSPT
jgi:alkanesulfonate monooxygenase SsuD/methylene tetrahydromethanopterin reductase-like flavin-dependent oxidoreductase (luciferase family)